MRPPREPTYRQCGRACRCLPFRPRMEPGWKCSSTSLSVGLPSCVPRLRHDSSYKSGEMTSFLSIIAVGFFLGMRHATDPDHVIAVTTIVTRQRQLTRAALTGAFWGVGHTLTIFVVGAIIILFDVIIPTRIGLSMEFSVALMLIFLGIMNVAAFMRSAKLVGADASAGSEVLKTH